MSCERKSPFATTPEEEQSAARVLYRYRKWSIGDSLDVVVRCEVNALSGDSASYALVGALHEWNPKMTDWRRLL